MGSVASWCFLLPPTLCSPPHPLGPEGAAFSGPLLQEAPRPWQCVCVSPRGSLSAVARDTCVVLTQALLTSKACLSLPHSPAPVLSVHPLVSPAQRPSNCSLPSLKLGRPGASGIHLCSLPSHIGGASCRVLSQWELGPYSQAFPPSCSVMSWSAWQVQLGRRPHGSSKDRAPPSGWRRWDWTEMPAPSRVSSEQSTEQPPRASDSPCPLPSTGLIFVTSDASFSTEKRKV